MATFVLIPGSGSTSWYWHLVVPKLRVAGHDTVAVDLPCDDDSAGLATYTDTPWSLAAWPDVPTRFLLCRDDRFFPADFLRRVVRQRLGITPDEMDGGHLPALARPQELAQRLLAYASSSPS